MRPIVSLRDLCWRLQYPRNRLREIADNRNAHYRVWTEPNRSGTKLREYQAPSDELKDIQRRLVANVLSEYELSDVVHGAVRQ